MNVSLLMFGPVQSQWIIYLSGLALDTSLLQCLVVTVTAVSNAPKASWVVMYTMNNHILLSDNRLAKKLFRS